MEKFEKVVEWKGGENTWLILPYFILLLIAWTMLSDVAFWKGAIILFLSVIAG